MLCLTSDRVRAAEIPVPGGDHSKSALALVTGADCCCGPKPPAAPSSTPSTRAAAGSRPV